MVFYVYFFVYSIDSIFAMMGDLSKGLNPNVYLKSRILATIQDDCLSGLGFCYWVFFKFVASFF